MKGWGVGEAHAAFLLPGRATGFGAVDRRLDAFTIRIHVFMQVTQ